MRTAAAKAGKPKSFKDRIAWRAWLEKNHGKKRELWLAYYKKSSGKKSITYEEALQEALCYGWIDSTIGKLDAERYVQRWTPRKPRSIWSASNKARVRRLIAEGRLFSLPGGDVRLAAGYEFMHDSFKQRLPLLVQNAGELHDENAV